MILDILMIAVIATLYRKNVISLAYHEVVGLALGLLMMIHLFFNRKWVAGVIKNKTHLSGRVRALALVDLLLTISWIAVMITGVAISKKLFSFGGEGIWIRLHFFSSAVALILTGVHLAMHRNFFAGFFKSKLAVGFLILLTLAGCWGITRLNIRTWFMAPFISRRDFGPRDAEGEEVSTSQVKNAHGRKHGDEPFSPIGLLEVVFGVALVILVVNAGEYAFEKIILKKQGKKVS